MDIKGIQKLTLLDFPGKVGCTVFTGGCNFRCPFCQNSDLVISPRLTPTIPVSDIFDFLKKRRGLIDGVCITGGEPLLQSDLVDFISECKALGYLVKLDMNGSLPDKLAAVISDGNVDYIAMDIKTSPERYGVLTGIRDFDVSPILESVDMIRGSGVGHEFRTTVVGTLHRAEDFESIGKWLAGEERYFLQKFVDSGALICDGLSPADDDTMRDYLRIVQKYIPTAELRGL